MSLHPSGPYQDRVEEVGSVLMYDGNDEPRAENTKNPKSVDQPGFLPSGNLADNGKFHTVAQNYKAGLKNPGVVRVYEKIKKGIWSDNGYFHLVDSWRESDATRQVFKFKLVAVEGVDSDEVPEDEQAIESKRSRIIPTHIKLQVWKPDGGKCVECSATDELH